MKYRSAKASGIPLLPKNAGPTPESPATFLSTQNNREEK
jgi:hypothetical protein